MSLLSPYYDASFDGVSFWEQSQSGFYPQRSVTTEGSTQHTPASSSNSFDDQGAGAEPFELTVGVDGAEYLALLAKRGDSGALSYSGGSVSALLLDILDRPGKAGSYDAYTIGLRFQSGVTRYRPQLSIQLDTAVFPAHSTTDITAYLAPNGFDVDLNVDADNGSATVTLTSLPGAADEGVRIYIYGDGELLFNGEIAIGGTSWNSDGTATLSCVDSLYKLRKLYGGVDRSYSPANVPPSTDTNTAENVIEAGGVDATLQHTEGEGRALGTAQDVIIRGGGIDIDGNPSAADSLMEFLRLLDKSVIPNYATFTRADGAVWRLPRTIGSSVASFSESNAWGWDRKRQPGTTINKWLIKGLVIAGEPTEAEASASNSFLIAPWEYNQDTFESYLVDDPTWAQDLADWKLSDTNGRLNVVSWTSRLNNDKALLGATVTVTSSRRSLSSQLVYVTSIKHHVSSNTATTTFTATFRD